MNPHDDGPLYPLRGQLQYFPALEAVGRMRAFRQLIIEAGMACAWSRSCMGGWAIAQSPIMGTTATKARLVD